MVTQKPVRTWSRLLICLRHFFRSTAFTFTCFRSGVRNMFWVIIWYKYHGYYDEIYRIIVVNIYWTQKKNNLLFFVSRIMTCIKIRKMLTFYLFLFLSSKLLSQLLHENINLIMKIESIYAGFLDKVKASSLADPIRTGRIDKMERARYWQGGAQIHVSLVTYILLTAQGEYAGYLKKVKKCGTADTFRVVE